MKIAIMGYGAWGRALAKVFADMNLSVMAWSSQAITDDRIEITNDIFSIQNAQVIFLVVPAQAMREVCQELKRINIHPKVPIIICSKGIECHNLALMSDIVAEILAHKAIAVLSGPNFAHEIMSGLPCSATLACQDQNIAHNLMKSLSSKNLILHPHSDIIGAQIFGAVKNVIAIACGIFEGKKLGQNATSSLITAGLQEIQKLSIAKGGKLETALALCGIGDLVLTCSSRKSRNVSLGYELAMGMTYQQILTATKTVIEGAFTAKALHQLAQKLNIQMPISQIIYDIIYNDEPIDQAVTRMLMFI